jgi:DNA mismatch repair ATPase MutS
MVPAAAMKLSPVDRIFTRLGAQDNIVGGASTFLVELQVSSYICQAFHYK